MNKTLRALVRATAAVSFVAVAAGTASAQSSTEAKCHATIAKNITKYQATLVKNQIGCHASRNGAKIASGTNCNDTMGADLKGGRAGARSKVSAAIAKACLLPDSAAVLALYPRCPSPVKTSDDGGATDGIDTFAELAECLLNLSEEYIERAGAEVMGAPTGPFPLAKPLTSCTGGVGKAYAKAMATAGKERSKCQAGREKSALGLDYDTCADANPGDAGGKIAAALAAVDSVIASSCGSLSQTDLASLGLCGQNTSALQTCVVDRVVKPMGNGLVAAAHELPNQCASFADVVANAGNGAKLSNTRLDSGFSGLAHDVDVVDGFLGGVELSGCDADCEDCDVTLDPTNGYCRCDNDVTIECSTINGADAACGGNNCTCMFGPPLPLSSGGSPVCVVNKFQEEFDGSTGAIGTYDVGTRTAAVVHLGIDQLQPCPVCNGDTTPNDGTRGGTCSGGARNGSSCDENAEHPDFGPTSFDCPPASIQNISGTGLKLDLRFTSGSQSITASISNVAQCSTGTCHCSQCSGDESVGCSEDADCAAFGAGTCTSTADVSKQNECTTLGSCTDSDGDTVGVCNGPIDKFCDGALRADGRGILPCSVDADCEALDSICDGGDCGSCTINAIRSCFMPTITATGTAGIFNSEGASTFCTAATSNSGVNSAGGLPGPGKVKLDFDFNLYCANHSTQYELPGGSNCP